MRPVIQATLTVMALCTGVITAKATNAGVTVAYRPVNPIQGSAMVVQVTDGARLQAVEGTLNGTTLQFFAASGGGFVALAGIDLKARPGSTPMRVVVTYESGGTETTIIQVPVREGSFGEQRLTLPPEKVELKGEALQRVMREGELVGNVLRVVSPERLWRGSFLKPVDGEVTGAFGIRRILNGKPRAPHSGVDIAAPLGTPVAASNEGVVAFVEELFLSGRTVIIDHGLGLFSIYMHLAEVLVREKSRVQRGDIVGGVGATGRVTGAHLHWGVRLGGARIDPFSLVALGSAGD